MSDLPPIPLSTRFFHCDALGFMAAQPPGFCDHIFTDPDISQVPTPVGALDTMLKFFPLAFRAIAPKGFLIFFHHFKFHDCLVEAAISSGFCVQYDPIMWNKLDVKKHKKTKPGQPFPHSYDTALVCWKPGTILTRVQSQSVYTTSGKSFCKEINDSRAKPLPIWRWWFSACTVPGQVIYDPFLGAGSCALSGIKYGLWCCGTEIDQLTYLKALANIKNQYVRLVGPEVKFS